MIRGKRGITSSTFKFILAAIAGALIFLFFIRFSFQSVETSSLLEERELIEHFNDHLEAFGISEQSYKTINLFDETTLQFDCTFIGNKGYTRNFNKLVFAPQTLTGEAITAWTRTWSFPFPIANLYYLSTDNVRTIVVYNQNTLSLIQKLNIPHTFNIQYTTAQNLDLPQLHANARSLDALNIIYLYDIPNPQAIIAALPNTNLHLAEINPVSHTFTIYTTGTNGFYLGEEMLPGIFFAPDNAPCIITAALERLQQVALVYSQKASLLSTKTDDEDCITRLFQAAQTLDTFRTLDDGVSLYTYLDLIKEQNTLLEKNDCTPLY